MVVTIPGPPKRHCFVTITGGAAVACNLCPPRPQGHSHPRPPPLLHSQGQAILERLGCDALALPAWV